MKESQNSYTPSTITDADKFVKDNPDYVVYDFYKDFMKEYIAVNNPKMYFAPSDIKDQMTEDFFKSLPYKGNWIVIPWNKELYHLPDKNTFLHLRTVRNRNLITKEEQEILYNKKISIAGLSVGSMVIMSFIRMGIGNSYKIADFDTVAPHNMNRANFYLRDTGRRKSEIIAENILSVDPYLEVELEGQINDDNLEDFFEGSDLIIDSFDHFPTKLKLRKFAKKLKIPVMSGFDISSGSMVIIERYDTEKDLSIDFYLNKITEKEILNPSKNPEEKTKMFINIIGEEYHDEKMLESVYSVGKSLTGYPQIVVATLATAALWTQVATEVLLGRSNKSKKEYMNLALIGETR